MGTCIISLNKEVGEVEKIIRHHEIRIHSWQCSKRIANTSPQSHLEKVFCRSVFKSSVRDQKRKVGSVKKYIFPLKTGFSSLLFLIPGKVEDLFEGQQAGFCERFQEGGGNDCLLAYCAIVSYICLMS